MICRWTFYGSTCADTTHVFTREHTPSPFPLFHPGLVGWGVRGAAYATVIAQYIGLAAYLAMLFGRRKVCFEFVNVCVDM